VNRLILRVNSGESESPLSRRGRVREGEMNFLPAKLTDLDPIRFATIFLNG